MEDEPGAPPMSDQCVFLKRGDEDTRVFVPGERVCVKNHEGERTMGKIVEHTPHDYVKLTLDTDFPSRLAKGRDRSGAVLLQPKIHVGKLLATESENPTAGRRSATKRIRKITRRHRNRKSSRKLRFKFF
jgi:hypothetical protein